MDFITNLIMKTYRRIVHKIAYKTILKKLENEGISRDEFEHINALSKKLTEKGQALSYGND